MNPAIVAPGGVSLSSDSVPRTRWCTWASILLADVFALTLSGTLAVLLRFIFNGQFDLIDYAPFWFAPVLFVAIFSLTGLYPGIAMNPVDELRRLWCSVTLAYLIIVTVTFLAHHADNYSRLIFVIAWMMSSCLVVLCRTFVRSALSPKSWWGEPVVILGAGEPGILVAETLRKHPELGLKAFGFLDDRANPRDASLPDTDLPLLGAFELAPVLARQHGVRYAIVALPTVPGPRLGNILTKYAQSFDRVIVIPDLFGVSSLWVAAKDLGGLLCLEVRQTLMQRVPQITKRSFDLALSILVASSCLPVFALLYVLVRATSRGPALYSQTRIGKNNRPFTAWKFRSMVADADKVLQAHLNRSPELRREWAENQKLRNDPRITLMGKFLRKTSLDELPQIWNVLRGDMSLVGPRPIVQNEIAKYGTRFDLYQMVRPGITGLWQISGRNHTTYEERVRYDDYYVRNWSVWLDLYILGCTIKTVLLTEGAY